MLFNSYFFIFIFLPLLLAGWFGLNRIKKEKAAQGYLVLMSLWFYAYFNLHYLWLLLGSCLVSYMLSALFDRFSEKKQRKAVLFTGCLFHLGALGFFKYSNFFLENVNAVFRTDFALLELFLLLGISFYTFQQLAFLIDRYRGDAKQCSFTDYLTFMTYFPQVLQGPILLQEEILPQLHDPQRRQFDAGRFAAGIRHFVIGLSKKVLLADTLAQVVNFGYDHVAWLDSASALLLAVGYLFELYFDFSGYCDMAVGLGKMVGIEIPENFDSPFKSTSVKEFWRRWHITLGRFFTRYVYIPLGGSRHGKRRAILNTMIVFALSGLWHGASWAFVFWGVLHGIGVAWSALWSRGDRRSEDKEAVVCAGQSGVLPRRPDGTNNPAVARRADRFTLPGWLRCFVTFSYVCLAFLFFRASTVAEGFEVIWAIAVPKWNGFLFRMAEALDLSELYVVTKAISMKAPALLSYYHLCLLLFLFLICLVVLAAKRAKILVEEAQNTCRGRFLLAILFVWSLLSLTGVSSYIYFSF